MWLLLGLLACGGEVEVEQFGGIFQDGCAPDDGGATELLIDATTQCEAPADDSYGVLTFYSRSYTAGDVYTLVDGMAQAAWYDDGVRTLATVVELTIVADEGDSLSTSFHLELEDGRVIDGEAALLRCETKVICG